MKNGAASFAGTGISIVLRLLALILVAAALILLGADLVTSLETGKITTRSLAHLWAFLDKSEPAAFLGWANTRLPAPLPDWSRVALGFWGWAVTGVLALLLMAVGRRGDL